MQLPPITTTEPAASQRPFARSIYSPRTRASYAIYRLFNGEERPTLSVKDQVAVTIAERIVEQRLKPGQRISEQSIADEFKVSKAPVSEALMLLEYTGLVESAARRSAYVTRISAADYEELIEYRAALAGVFFPRFVERHSPADRKVLREYLEHMQELVSDDARTFEFAEVADRSILYVAMQSGNRRIARAMSPLSLQLLRYYAISVRTARQRKQRLEPWIEALKILETRDLKRFMALVTARTRLATAAKAAQPLARPGGVAASRLFVGRSQPAWTLPEQIAAEVGERILDEVIAPGDRIGEEKLAREFGVSRGPIRDALKLLEQAGLVTIASRKGTIATPLTDQDMHEIFVLRSGLSEIALRGFVDHAAPENLAHFRRHLQAAESLADDDRRVLFWTEANDRLMLFIAHNCGNSRVARQLTALSLQSIRYVRRATAAGLNPAPKRRELVRFYRDLLAAYEKRGDVEPLVQRLRRMIGERIQVTRSVLPAAPG
jgi:DNA-binding GntR family transcriptional regulator